jgi:predicted phosphodiesterase
MHDDVADDGPKIIGNIKIVCLSDLHGHLPEVPDADLLLLAGDYCPTTKDQNWWLRDSFEPWLHEKSLRMIVVGIAGNHDLIFEKRPDLVPRLSWKYLQDSAVRVSFEHKGSLKIYGTPWQLRFCDWAFNLDEKELDDKFAMIPDDTDVILTHGPPWGIGDQTDHKDRIGSRGLLKRCNEIQPKLVVYGHNHSGYGVRTNPVAPGPVFVNCAHMDEQYRPVNQPVVIELE